MPANEQPGAVSQLRQPEEPLPSTGQSEPKEEVKKARAANLFDIRRLIGVVFGVYGAVLTIIGIFVAIALTGTVLTETVFTRPGLGKMLVDAIGSRDYPLAQGAITVFTMIIILVNLVVDMLYAVVDPRVAYR